MPTDKRKAANIAKARKRSGTKSTVTEPLTIRVPVGLTKEQRAEARKVAQECVENWNTLRKMYGEVKG